ncbi:MAG: translation initiation factor IF-2 [Bacteroidales bacterium]|jgi:translation initiation factor IF-2|nr:translation initiation factor IF-2 [Bacteroidales bacterium]
MAEIKLPRLGKAAIEFNVSMQTVIAFLNKKGLAIEDNPNAKLTEKQYTALVNEYQIEKKLKEKVLGTSASKPEAAPKVTQKPEEKPFSIDPKPVAKIESAVQFDKKPKKIEKAGGTVVPEKTDKQAEPKKTLEKTTKTVKKTDEQPVKPKEKKKSAETKPIKINPVQEIKPETEVQPVKPVTEPKSVKEEQPVEKPKETKKETVENTPVKEPEKIESEKQEPEHISHLNPIIQKPKILGTIDLDSINSATKPKRKKRKKKSRENTQAEAETTVQKQSETKQPPKPQQQEVKPPVPEIESNKPRKVEFIETKVEKLQGPKILGSIQLPVEKKPEKGKSNKGDIVKKDRKRKRIKTKVNSERAQQPAEKPRKAPVVISEIDIQRQIKETRMRLEPLGKSKASKRRREKRQQIMEETQERALQQLKEQKILKVMEFITANELATLMDISVNQIISTCMSIGIFVSINQRLDAETIALLADEYGHKVEFVSVDDEDGSQELVDSPEDLVPRHPIITVMGHVDHGKTSLLDYIRKANVIAGEEGGITQHIGAYEVVLNDGRKITFLDTPGHEAFTAMRARGAKVTDLCIIVIAADDSVMPQTKEAINHAQAAGVPMVFAFTKIDKANAHPERIREELAAMNILVEDWGGKYQCQEIDAKHGTNVKELLEKVLLEAEMLELEANPNRSGIGTVIESSLDRGKGYVAKVLVQSGTLKIGDPVLAGSCFGKVKALYNERNQTVQSAGPATPVLLLGLNGAPQAGDIFKVCASEHDARIIATKKAQLVREIGLRAQKHITLDEIGRRIVIGDFKELNIIVKGDVIGSVEALTNSLLKLSTEQVQVNVIHSAVGAVTESDVVLASASNAIIVAFQVRPTHGSRKLAEQEEIDIRTYSVIFKAINEIKDAIAGMHSPEIHEKILCNLEVREVYKITKVGNIAGCLMLDGKLQRNTRIRLIRDGIVIHSGKLGSLRRFKDDVKEVSVGQDCGLNIDNFNDIKVGDIIEGYEEYEVKVTL